MNHNSLLKVHISETIWRVYVKGIIRFAAVKKNCRKIIFTVTNFYTFESFT